MNTMLQTKTSNAELTRLLGTRPQEIQRIMSLGHSTKIDTIANALNALGKHLELVAI
ncbi:helix-turn-helix domain-containing protein [Photorhabdus namnaonensis]|uniref:helix-turn-helix domain-containing protein n=1 Tax=Photorhabdus namnaonensis TaxID=1851568 RepID=UPI0013F4C7CB|nr:hypothetical protein [Photorhabdus namnaonensis]